jgi:hypothetical protein
MAKWQNWEVLLRISGKIEVLVDKTEIRVGHSATGYRLMVEMIGSQNWWVL